MSTMDQDRPGVPGDQSFELMGLLRPNDRLTMSHPASPCRYHYQDEAGAIRDDATLPITMISSMTAGRSVSRWIGPFLEGTESLSSTRITPRAFGVVWNGN